MEIKKVRWWLGIGVERRGRERSRREEPFRWLNRSWSTAFLSLPLCYYHLSCCFAQGATRDFFENKSIDDWCDDSKKSVPNRRTRKKNRNLTFFFFTLLLPSSHLKNLTTCHIWCYVKKKKKNIVSSSSFEPSFFFCHARNEPKEKTTKKQNFVEHKRRGGQRDSSRASGSKSHTLSVQSNH